MKKQYKQKPKQKAQRTAKVLAEQFEQDLNRVLPITVQPNGSIVYKQYLIKPLKNGNWAVFSIPGKAIIEQFFLKSCALMAAKAYDKVDLNKFSEIKMLDNKYWSNYSDTLIYENNIKNAKDFDRYCILLNRLEHSRDLAKHFRETISTMFKWSFV